VSRTFDDPRTWGEYVRGHLLRVLFVVACDASLLYLALRIGEERAWYSEAWTWRYLGWPSVLLYMVMLGLSLSPPLHYWQLRKDARERQDAMHRRDVLVKMSVSEEIEVPFGLRLEHAARASVGTLVAVGCVEVFIVGVLAYNAHDFTYGNVSAKATTAAFFLSVLPAWTAFALWRQATTKGTASNARARVEHAYREAVVDREQLAGGLEIDARAGGSGGELTVQAEAGGLEVREEVALGSVGIEGARVGEELEAEQEDAVEAAVAEHVEAT
jgi:hypothetical protein